MVEPSYRLENSRSRQPPVPLRFEHSFTSPAGLSSLPSPTLLYDIPSASSISPPSSPTSLYRLNSPPTSPGRSEFRRNGRPTPPPGRRRRSVTPAGVASSDLEKFSEHCRSWYFNQDEESGRLMTQTMANLPPSQRAPYSRAQASIRSAYHRSVNARRTAEFKAHLSATQPGGSLNPHCRMDPHGSAAQKERYLRFERFIRSWCTLGMPGPQPFFQALWALMRLQVVSERKGGAGKHRIEWQFDDAVLKEAAGKDFMLEAIDVLKGVLAFEETPSSRRSSTPNSNDIYRDASPIHLRSQSQPLFSDKGTKAVRTNRSRAPSDPFLDTPVLSRSAGSSSSQFSTQTSSLFTKVQSDVLEEPLSPITASVEESHAPPQHDLSIDDTEEEYLRVWTSPDLPNVEYHRLLKLFPSHITKRPSPHFPIPSTTRNHDLEEGFDDPSEDKVIRFGTGTLRVSSSPRSDHLQWGWWTRFMLWFKRTFC